MTTPSNATVADPVAAETPKRRYRRRKGPPSTIERHPRFAEIEADLAAGGSTRVLAKRYGVGHNALHRHLQKLRRDHPEVIKALAADSWQVAPAEMEALRIETSAGWLAQLRAQFSKLVTAQDDCIRHGNHGHAVGYAARANDALRILGTAVGEIAQHSTTINNTVVLAAGYVELRAALVGALREHPDALAAVIQTFRQAEAVAFGAGAGNAPLQIEAKVVTP